MRINPSICIAFLILFSFNIASAQTDADTSYFANGRIESIGVLIDGERDGKWIWYHENGKKCGKEEYRKGKVLKSKYWDKYGNKSDNSEVRTSPEYPGGLDAFLTMVGQNLVYPPHLAKEGKEGRSIIQFTIDLNGKVVNPVVVKRAHPDFDKEALRVVLMSKTWNPGTFHGESSLTVMTFPVNFELE